MAALLERAGAALTSIPRRSEVRSLLAAHGLVAHKRRGQNFVVDPNTVRAVVRRAEVQPDEAVVEIGPGLGALTLGLVEVGARVLAVEVDSGLVRALEEILQGTDVRLLHADALTVDWAELVGGDAPVLVANLPYHIATPLVFHALESGCFTRAHVMVQREVGERWAARVGDPLYSGVTVRLATLADVAVDQRISRRAFFPVPGVDSVTVRLTPRAWTAEVDRHEVALLVEAGFAQRRKRLRNALATPARPPGRVEDALGRIGRSTGARAEELDLDAWIALASALRD